MRSNSTTLLPLAVASLAASSQAGATAVPTASTLSTNLNGPAFTFTDTATPGSGSATPSALASPTAGATAVPSTTISVWPVTDVPGQTATLIGAATLFAGCTYMARSATGYLMAPGGTFATFAPSQDGPGEVAIEGSSSADGVLVSWSATVSDDHFVTDGVAVPVVATLTAGKSATATTTPAATSATASSPGASSTPLGNAGEPAVVVSRVRVVAAVSVLFMALGSR